MLHLPLEVRKGHGLAWNWNHKIVVSHQYGYWELNLSPLEEQSMLFTAKPSLQCSAPQPQLTKDKLKMMAYVHSQDLGGRSINASVRLVCCTWHVLGPPGYIGTNFLKRHRRVRKRSILWGRVLPTKGMSTWMCLPSAWRVSDLLELELYRWL